MAFEKTQPVTAQRERYDIYSQKDKDEILAFEKELASYLERSTTICGHYLKGFNLYLHENGMYVYSSKYPDGAVRSDKLEEYRLVNLKYSALTNLWDKRRLAKEKEMARIQTLIPEGVTA